MRIFMSSKMRSPGRGFSPEPARSTHGDRSRPAKRVATMYTLDNIYYSVIKIAQDSGVASQRSRVYQVVMPSCRQLHRINHFWPQGAACPPSYP